MADEGGKDGKGGKAVLQVSRRTWDTEEYQKRADERREEEEKIEAEVWRIALPACVQTVHAPGKAWLTTTLARSSPCTVCIAEQKEAAASKPTGALIRRDPLNKDR